MTHVAIAGAGDSALIQGCLLRHRGREVTVWSPSGDSTRALRKGARLEATGALNGEFDVHAAISPQELTASAQTVLVSVPAYAQPAVFRELVPHLSDDHIVLITGAPLSFGGLYLSRLLAQAGKRTRIGVQGGPMGTGRRLTETRVALPTPPSKTRLAAIPSREIDGVLAAANAAYDRKLTPSASALEVGLASIAGVYHVAMTLCNLTRFEFAEDWCHYKNTTDSVSRLTMALDKDRLALAAAYGFEIKDVVAHFDPSGKAATVQEALQPLSYFRSYKNGPRTIETRFIHEEIPYNLVSVEILARKVGLAVPAISNLVTLFGAIRGKDFRRRNIMANELGIEAMSKAELEERFRSGFPAK